MKKLKLAALLFASVALIATPSCDKDNDGPSSGQNSNTGGGNGGGNGDDNGDDNGGNNENPDEPNNPDVPDVISGQLLSTITVSGQTFYSYQYDSQNRVSRMQDPFQTIMISYNPLRITLIYNNENTLQPEYEETWSNITTNSYGFITSAECSQFAYANPNYEWTYSQSFLYTNDGYLLSILWTDEEYGDESTVFKWNNGQLTEIGWENEDGYEPGYLLGYSGTKDNVHGQWFPLWADGMAALFMSNLFGYAPSQFPTSESMDGYAMRYQYTLSNDYINSVVVAAPGMSALNFVYNYVETKAGNEMPSVSPELAKKLHKTSKHHIFSRHIGR